MPTFNESGVKGYEVSNWFGLMAPIKVPREVVTRVNADVNKVLDTGDTRQKLTSQGFDVYGGTPGEFNATIKADTRIFADTLRKAGITAQ